MKAFKNLLFLQNKAQITNLRQQGKKLFDKKDNRRLIENFFSLSVLNFINYLFPLILIPYLTRILGVEKFGLYAFSFAIIQYCTLLVGYGFNFSATKFVAINRDDNEKISKIFISATIVRIILALICILLIILALNLFDKLREEAFLYIYGIGIFVGQSLTPLWLFQGMEKMKYVTIINFVSKLTSTVLIFVFLKNQSDYIYVNLYFSAGFLIAGILSLILAIQLFKIKFKVPKATFVFQQFREGWHLFLSTVFMSFYRETNIIILGSFTNYTIVGYYAAAEKIVKAVQSIISPVTNALYPYFGRNLNSEDKRNKALKNFFSFNRYYTIALLIIVVGILLSSKFIVIGYIGSSYMNSILNIQIMSPLILIGGLNYFLGIVGLVNLGYEKQFTFSVIIAGLSSVISSIILVNLFSDIGASISIVFAETVLLMLILNQYRIKKKFIYVK